MSEASLTPRAAGAADVRLVDEHANRVVALRVDSSSQATPAPGGAQLPGRRSALATRALGLTLIVLGVLALADALVTLVWQEPISALIATLRQDNLRGALRAEERAAPTAAEQRTLASLGDERRRIAFLASELQRRQPDGAAVGRIVIPRIGASFVVVKGTSTADLESGPGIFSETSFPGASQTTAIAGHRTTYLAPFRHIDALRAGDRIALNMPYAHFTYTVIGHRVVSPHDVSAAEAELGYTRLVLSACTPLFSAAKRWLVFATLTRTVPVGAARELPGGALARPIEAPPPAVAVRAPLPPVLETLDPHVLAPLS
ncbi:MAG TPA: class E sortase [Solirubrobacteraceae bacterium]